MPVALLPAVEPPRDARPQRTTQPWGRITALCVLGVLAMATIGLGMLGLVDDEHAASDWIGHTERVLIQSADLELHVQTAVSEARGYFVSKDPTDGDRFEAAVRHVGADLAALRTLIRDNPEQLAIVQHLGPLIAGRLSVLRRLSGLVNGGETPLPYAPTLMASAVDQAHQIAADLTHLRSEATLTLDKHEAAVARGRRLTTAAITVSGALLSASALLVVTLLARQRRERAHMGALTQLNLALEARVRERTAELRLAHERMALATDIGDIGIWDWDLATDRVVWDRAMCRRYGTTASEASREVWRRLVHPDDLPAVEAAIQDAVAGRSSLDVEFRIIRADGSIRDVRTSGRVIRDEAGTKRRLIGVNWDVTERRQLIAALAEQREMLAVTLESIGDGVITADACGRVRWLNPAAERMTGWPASEAIGLPATEVFRIVHAGDRLPRENPLMRCLAERKVVTAQRDCVLLPRAGPEIGIENSAAPIRNKRGELLGVVLVFRDVTEQRRRSDEMRYRASHDELTGLVNRAELETRLREKLRLASHEDSQHALLYLDLDQFKIVNDTCGHFAGDQLLRQVARLLRGIVRTGDTVARLGGDEFAVILDHCDPLPAERLAQRICDAAEARAFTHGGRRFRIGTSIGLVAVDRRWTDVAALLQAADTACYAAKAAGRNLVHVWRDPDESLNAAHGQTQWAARLEQALDADEFVLFAQRIESLRPVESGLCVEVLPRLAAPDGTLALPAAFLPAAERLQLRARIDRWVLDRTLAWLRGAPVADRVAMVAISLSCQSIADRAFQRWLLDMLAGAAPELRGKLCLEVSEAAAGVALAEAADFLREARALGARVALDDFGTSAASVGYPAPLTVDFLKIDGQFIRDLATDELAGAAVRYFADIARLASVQTVADCVADQAVLDRLRAIGIDFAQGDLIGAPVPLGELG